ncbi:MAG: replicative DNA helicase [Planctomycetota bacterium]
MDDPQSSHPRQRNGARSPDSAREAARDLGKLFDAPPPHAPEAEMALLGSMILEPQVVGEVLPMIATPEVFYLEKNALVFKALLQLFDKNNTGDLVQLVETLKGWNVLDRIGGTAYLQELASCVPSAANAPFYAGLVAAKHKLRRLIDAAGTILHEAYTTGGQSPDEAQNVVDKAERSVFEIAEEAETSEPQELRQLLHRELDRLEANEGKGIIGVPTGYLDLDDMLKGLQPGELIIVAARPSMGKTALALNLAEQIAMGGADPWSRPTSDRSPVAFFSLEMSREAVTQRMLAAYAKIDMNIFRSGQKFREREFQSIVDACGKLGDAPIHIDDTPGLTVMGLRARARRMAARHGVKCIMIDYLQLLSSPSHGRESRQVEVSAISRGIKALARELNVPIICLSQLNRATEQREGNRPRMSDLRESGSIEQDADVVALLHREEYYHVNDPSWGDEHPDKVGIAEVIIAKQRNGPTGVVKLTWDRGSTRFKNHDERQHAPPGVAGGYDYSSPAAAAQQFPSSYHEPKSPASSQPPTHAPPKPQMGSSFENRARTGPPEDHRDGGGPTSFDQNDVDVPF